MPSVRAKGAGCSAPGVPGVPRQGCRAFRCHWNRNFASVERGFLFGLPKRDSQAFAFWLFSFLSFSFQFFFLTRFAVGVCIMVLSEGLAKPYHPFLFFSSFPGPGRNPVSSAASCNTSVPFDEHCPKPFEEHCPRHFEEHCPRHFEEHCPKHFEEHA